MAELFSDHLGYFGVFVLSGAPGAATDWWRGGFLRLDFFSSLVKYGNLYRDRDFQGLDLLGFDPICGYLLPQTIPASLVVSRIMVLTYLILLQA
jgi:hypothetical protein